MPCVVFAGGKSSRMGQNKAFLPFGNYDSLTKYQVQRLEKLFDKVYISAKEKSTFSGISTSVIEDTLYPDISAPTTGFINIFKQLRAEDSFFILSVDTPFVNEALISKLISKANARQYDAIIARTPSGIHPLCGVYTRNLEEPIKEMIENEEYKLSRLLQKAKVYYVDVEDEHILSNLNTPQQYQKALDSLKN